MTLKPYHAYLDLLVDRFDELRYIHLPKAENQFANALATLTSIIEIPAGVTVRPLLIKTKYAPTYCCLIGDIEDRDELPWYHDIYQFLSCDAYPESSWAKDKRALRHLAFRFVVCRDALYRRSPDGMLLLCLDRASADRVMRKVHAVVCGPPMTVIEFVVRFTELARFANDYVATDLAKVRRFENGLRLSIRGRIVGLRLQDMDSMVGTAMIIEREIEDA